MASIEERGDGFRVRWRTLAGEPRSRQCPDRATARRLKAEVEREQALGRDWQAGDQGRAAETLDELAADYLADCTRRLRPGTVENKMGTLGKLLDWLPAGFSPADLSREVLHRWHAQLVTRVDRRTAANQLHESGRMWRWAADSDRWCNVVPRPRTLDPGPVPAPPHIPGPTLAQVDMAIAAAGTYRLRWYRRLMVVMRHTGLRAGQVGALDWPDVDIDGLRLTVRPELGKSRQEQRGRVVPLHPALAAELAGWGRREGPLLGMVRHGGRWCRHGAPSDKPLVRIWGRAGVEVRQPLHGIRHAVATHLRATGTPEDVVGYLLGHAAGVTGAHYINPAALWPDLVSAVASIPPLCAHGVSDLDLRRRRPLKSQAES